MRVPLPFSIQELSEPHHGLLLDAVEALADHGVAQLVERSTGCALDTSLLSWAQYGESALCRTSDDEEGLLAERVAVLERLLAPRTGTVSFRLEGLPGKRSAACRVFLDGHELLADLDSNRIVHGNDEFQAGPLLAHLVVEARRYATASDRREALSRLARIARATRALQDTSAGRLTFDLPSTIAKHEAIRAVAVRFAVKDIEPAGWVGIRSEVTDELGEKTVVSSRTLDSSGAFLESASGRLIELSQTQAAALRQMKSHVATRASTLARNHALERPETLLSPEARDETMEFAGYSERVLGFAPVAANELLPSRVDYGVRWYDEDDQAAASLYLVITATSADGETSSLPIESRVEAEKILDSCEQATRTGNQPVFVGGTAIESPANFAPVLREAIAKRDEEERRALEPREGAERHTARAAQLADAASVLLEEPDVEYEPDWHALEAMVAPSVKLKAHQRDGIRWLWSRYSHAARAAARGGTGALLADDMGLGKTLQLACLLALASRSVTPARRPSLIVAPKILLKTWEDECLKFFRPRTLSPKRFASSDLAPGRGALVDTDGRIRSRAIAEHELWITNYETLQAYGERLALIDWDIVVLDEAQAIKNPMTAVSRNVRALKRTFAVAATGTPIENRLTDLFPLADFAVEGVLAKNLKDFEARYPADAESSPTELRKALRVGHGSAAALLRREKSDIAAELSRKLEHVVLSEMTQQQRKLESELVRAASGTSHGQLRLIGELQKLYQHPRLLAQAGDDRAPVETLSHESPKLAWLRTFLRERRTSGDKVLIFALWRRMQDIIRSMLEADFPREMRQRNVTINGEPASVARAQQRIDTFSATEGFDVLILSPKVAGTGLTITAANHVVHYGRWWNPAREDQATDRAYRIGQKRDVHVHIPIVHHPGDARAGFDVALHELVGRKRELAADFLSPAGGDATAREIASLIA
jgi:hypothetical protein